MRAILAAAALATFALTSAAHAAAPHDGDMGIECTGHVAYHKCIVSNGAPWQLDREASTLTEVAEAPLGLTLTFDDSRAELTLCNTSSAGFATDFNLQYLHFGDIVGTEKFCSDADDRAERALVSNLSGHYTSAEAGLERLVITTDAGTLVFRP